MENTFQSSFIGFLLIFTPDLEEILGVIKLYEIVIHNFHNDGTVSLAPDFKLYFFDLIKL